MSVSKYSRSQNRPRRLSARARYGAVSATAGGHRRANGYVRGEGVGAVLLKPLSRAEQDGDHIYGVIRGSAVNHGGRAASMTAPNPEAQAELLAAAWKQAGIAPETISYIEAHGTGTELGDPIEIQGMHLAFAQSTQRREFCGTGSLKSNIGHLEPASGIASLIKVLLSMEHGTIPASLHCEELNPHIRFEGGPVYVVTKPRNWAANGTPRRAGVSSFGFGGVNAHLLVEEAPPATSTPSTGTYVFVFSARTAMALNAYLERFRKFLQSGDLNLADRPSPLPSPSGRELKDCRYSNAAKKDTL